MNNYMFIADKLAKQNNMTNNGGPFGAVIVKNDVIVGVGKNTVVKNNDPTAHAEVMAIRNACENLDTFDLSNCELYTSCYPCPMCLSAIMWANIKTVYYGNTKEDAAEIGFRDDAIYKYLENPESKESCKVLKLLPMDRKDTIEAFMDFKRKTENKTMY